MTHRTLRPYLGASSTFSVSGVRRRGSPGVSPLPGRDVEVEGIATESFFGVRRKSCGVPCWGSILYGGRGTGWILTHPKN